MSSELGFPILGGSIAAAAILIWLQYRAVQPGPRRKRRSLPPWAVASITVAVGVVLTVAVVIHLVE